MLRNRQYILFFNVLVWWCHFLLEWQYIPSGSINFCFPVWITSYNSKLYYMEFCVSYSIAVKLFLMPRYIVCKRVLVCACVTV